MAALDDDKLARLDALLDDEDLDEVWFLRPHNFAWITEGSSVVDRASDVGVAALGYDGQEARVLTANNEEERFREEEVPSEVAVRSFDWYATSLPEAVATESADAAGADLPSVPGLDTVDVGRYRLPLTERDRSRYEQASREATRALETVARKVTATHTEREAASLLHEELQSRGLGSPVVLVGGAERSQRHRHFTPKDEPLGRYGILTIVAVQDGLNVAATRTVAFDPPEWLADRYEAASRVAATAMAATADRSREAGTAGDVFDAIRTAYAEVGWEGEWQHHHQGGAIGFESREWVATPDAEDPVETPAPYAWNPTVQGAKTEDTVMVSADGVDVLTLTGDWPTAEYEAVGYDFTVELPEILQA